jgi:hypothetical protein
MVRQHARTVLHQSGRLRACNPASLYLHLGSACAGLGGVVTFFFHNPADFEEITAFTHATNKAYGLRMRVLEGDFKSGIEGLLASTPIKAIILGTRR